MKTDWKHGDTCYIIIPHTNGDFPSITDCIVRRKDAYGNYLCTKTLQTYTCITLKPEEMFETRDQAMTAIYDKTNAKIEQYKQSMSTVESLVTFAFQHNISNPQNKEQWDMRMAYSQQAHALMGLTLI